MATVDIRVDVPLKVADEIAAQVEKAWHSVKLNRASDYAPSGPGYEHWIITADELEPAGVLQFILGFIAGREHWIITTDKPEPAVMFQFMQGFIAGWRR